MDKLALRIRNVIVCTGLGLMILGTLHAYEDTSSSSEEFWPPDLVPHPHLPDPPGRPQPGGDLA